MATGAKTPTDRGEQQDGSGDAQPPAPPISGRILVGYHVSGKSLDGVRKNLQEVLRVVETEDEEDWISALSWGSIAEEWIEIDPGARLNHFEASKRGWGNESQPEILGAAIAGLSARIETGDLLPFEYLVFEFELGLTLKEGAPNHPDNLISIVQWCRGLTDWLLGDERPSRAQVLAITSKQVPREMLDKLREKELPLLEQADGEEIEQKEDTLEHALDPPLGARSGHGFSHYTIGVDVHAIIGSATSSKLAGPCWFMTIYEQQSDLEDGDGWGTGAVDLVDPLHEQRESVYIQSRPSGVLLLFVLWDWAADTRNTVRNLHARLTEVEGRLDGWLLGPKALGTWRRIEEVTGELRGIVHDLRSVDDEYGFSIERSVESLRESGSREVWVPAAGRLKRLDAEERQKQGEVSGALESFQRDFRRMLTSTERAWEMGQAQKEDYAVRIQRFVGFAVLLLAAVELAVFTTTQFLL